MSEAARVLLDAAIRRRAARPSTDPVALAQALGLQPDPWQVSVLRSTARQVLLLCSRQSGKSTVAALLAATEALHRAPALVLVLAPALRQAQESFRKIKGALVALGADAAPITQESALTLELANGSRIVTLPGKEGTIRGYSAVSLLLIDEASRVPDDLYQSVRPMLAVSRGRVVLLSTPCGKRGFFHHEYTEGGPDWHRVTVTAADCPRIDPAWLAAERQRIGLPGDPQPACRSGRAHARIRGLDGESRPGTEARAG